MNNPTPKFFPAAAWRVLPASDRWQAFLSSRASPTESHPWTRRSAVTCSWRATLVRASART